MKIKAIILSLAMVLLAVGVSFAALSAEQTAVVTATTTLVTDLTSMAWTFVLSVMGALVGIKLFKKFFGKSTS